MDEIRAGILRMRQYEKDSMLDKDDRFAATHDSVTRTIEVLSDSLSRDPRNAHYKREIADMRRAVHEYREAFEHYVGTADSRRAAQKSISAQGREVEKHAAAAYTLQQEKMKGAIRKGVRGERLGKRRRTAKPMALHVRRLRHGTRRTRHGSLDTVEMLPA